MALFSLLVQLVGIGVGIYLVFSRGLGAGAAMISIVALGHFAFMRLSDSLMKAHQQRLSAEALEELKLYALSNQNLGATPRAWKHIASACGAAYIALVVVGIWYMLG